MELLICISLLCMNQVDDVYPLDYEGQYHAEVWYNFYTQEEAYRVYTFGDDKLADHCSKRL